MTIIPITGDINPADYWQFHALSIEWLFIMQKLKDSVMAKEADRHCLLGVNAVDGTEVYFLSKKFYTAATIAKATGLPEEKIEAYSGVIKLKPPKVDEALPKATVDYWGTA